MSVRKSGDHRNREIVEDLEDSFEDSLWWSTPPQAGKTWEDFAQTLDPGIYTYEREVEKVGKQIGQLKRQQSAQNHNYHSQYKQHQVTYGGRGYGKSYRGNCYRSGRR